MSRTDPHALPHLELPGGLRVHEARTSRARRHGLARLDALDPDAGLWIAPCFSIHTFGMRFALDLIWLGRDRRVRSITAAVPPRRLHWDPGARSVIEVNAGRGEAFAAAWAAHTSA